MNEAGVGRVLVASLHQGIADLLPGRLEFYENWFHPTGLRDGRIGLASIAAVLSFLRQEGDSYGGVTRRAGEYAADWTFERLSALRRRMLQRMPEALRRRLALGVARRLVRETYGSSHAIVRRSRSRATFDLRGSIFCGVREPMPHPLCEFYASALARLFALCGLSCETRIGECRGAGGRVCLIEVAWLNHREEPRASSLGLGVLIVLLWSTAAASQDQIGKILVMPFEPSRHEPRTYWLGEAASILLVNNLNRLGDHAITRDERMRAFERLQVPPAAMLSQATIFRIAQLVGATDVVTGTLDLEGSNLEVRARYVQLETGRLGGDLVEKGPLDGLFDSFDRLARRLVSAEATTRPAGEPAASARPPLPAFENYVKGLIAETPGTQAGYLNAALTLSPDYAEARLALWSVYDAQGDHVSALDALSGVRADSPDVREARFCSSLSLVHLKRLDEAFALLRQLLAQGSDAAVLNNLGVVQIRRGSTPETGRATYYFTQAMRRDPADSDYYFNLGYAYWLEHDLQAAMYWLREAVRRNPADGDAHFVLSASLQSSGSPNEAGRERELAEKLSSRYLEWGRRPTPGSDSVPRGLERLRTDIGSRATDLESALEATEQREQRELVAFYVERGRRLFGQEHDREAVVELRRALFLSPYEAEAHLLLGRIYLRTGRTREAVEALKISLWSSETVEAHVALGEAFLSVKDESGARAEAERALKLDPDSADARKLLQSLRAQ